MMQRAFLARGLRVLVIVQMYDQHLARELRLLARSSERLRHEPALAAVDFTHWLPAVSWIVVGGESTQWKWRDLPELPARPFDLAWARRVLAQCRAAGAAPFVKQMGHHTLEAGVRLKFRDHTDPACWPAELQVQEYPRRTGP